MDSPIFGKLTSHNGPKNQKITQYSAYNSDINSSEWYVSNKSNSNTNNSQISTDLKLAYTLLIVEKNLKTLQAKINKCINKKKFQAFDRILKHSNKSSKYSQKASGQMQQSRQEAISNPQIKPLMIVCLTKTNLKIQSMCRVINQLKFKKMAKAWSRLYITLQKNHFPPTLNEYSSCIQSDLGICSKIETKKRLNSKKHAKQMKQNSILNQTSSDLEMQNQKLAQQIMSEQKTIDRFAQQMNNLLAYHESKFTVESDRETWLSDNGISHSSFENNMKSQGGKSHLNKRK